MGPGSDIESSMIVAPHYSGQLLLAMPGIGDTRFERSVIALCAHDGDGAMGINIGSEIPGLGLRELLANFDLDGSAVPDVAVLRGGPVEPRRGFVLHSLDWGGQEMLDVGGLWGLSGSLDVLKAIAENRGPSRYIVALGYAGWSAGQLDQEMQGHGWFMTPASEDLIFDVATENRWSAAFAAAGIDSAFLSSATGSA